MTKLKFRSYVFPHNPKKLTVEYSKNLKVFRPPLKTAVIQNLGDDFRVVKGVGEFYGDDAFVQFIKLSDEFGSPGTGILTLPGFDPFYAEFRSLSLNGEAGEGVIGYSFEFWEIQSQKVAVSGGLSSWNAAEGENLWTISAATGVSVERLLALNPFIKNPFDVSAGKEVALS